MFQEFKKDIVGNVLNILFVTMSGYMVWIWYQHDVNSKKRMNDYINGTEMRLYGLLVRQLEEKEKSDNRLYMACCVLPELLKVREKVM